MKKVYLVCNAHIDPVWLWEWPEGAAEALATFRVAARLCEQFDGFVFNHNEALLYQWVEEYEPALFERIQALVRQGRWHIMGGWYLQPDCNMPSGESLVRQIELGRRYFEAKFGVRPTTAINFDPFGHSRGLVQILAKSGFTSYLFCRPDQKDCPLPAEDFEWVGFDGSSVRGHRSLEFYNSALGEARSKVERWLGEHQTETTRPGLILWGVGNHGGGASYSDLTQLADLIKTARAEQDIEILHSTPEAYFEELAASGAKLPKFAASLNAWAVGCYTSQSLVKQRHRWLENELFLTEKIVSQATLYGLIKYPATELHEAQLDLAFCQFHDILPGTSIQPVEAAVLNRLGHGLEILSRLKTRAYFALASDQPAAQESTVPILVYNPHPFPVEGVFECEFQLTDQNWKAEFSNPRVFAGPDELPSQAEQELSSLNLDWRKRVAFRARLLPAQMNRFDCRLEVLPAKPLPHLQPQNGLISFQSAELEVVINCRTGLIDRYRVNGVDFLQPGAFLPLVLQDTDDSWGMLDNKFHTQVGTFLLMEEEANSQFSGVRGRLDSVRVIEDGPVRSVVEVVLGYQHSAICQRYKLPKQGTELEVELIVLWNEKSRMLKLSIPTAFEGKTRYLGQVAYGVEELAQAGREVVSQKWVGLVSDGTELMLSCINDGIYGSDCANGEIRLSLLRSPGYAAHPILDRPIMPQDRFSPRIDQGEHHYRFWINAGAATERLAKIDREATAHNEKPFVLSFFPAGQVAQPRPPALTLNDETVQVSVFKQAEDGSGDFILRLFEPTGTGRSTIIELPALHLSQSVNFEPFELKTMRISPTTRTITETSLLERL